MIYHTLTLLLFLSFAFSLSIVLAFLSLSFFCCVALPPFLCRPVGSLAWFVCIWYIKTLSVVRLNSALNGSRTRSRRWKEYEEKMRHPHRLNRFHSQFINFHPYRYYFKYESLEAMSFRSLSLKSIQYTQALGVSFVHWLQSPFFSYSSLLLGFVLFKANIKYVHYTYCMKCRKYEQTKCGRSMRSLEIFNLYSSLLSQGPRCIITHTIIVTFVWHLFFAMQMMCNFRHI